MVSKELIAYFKAAHGFYNICMLALFCAQGWMGYMIRQARQTGAPVPADLVRRHRRAGPVFALWGLAGYAAGIVVVLFDKGRVLEYPLHFLAGTAIAAAIVAVFSVSRSIAGSDARFRNIHFALGLVLLCLYVVQVLLGIGILL